MPSGWRRSDAWRVSVSHDLRHSLAAIVANAEFLCESHLNSQQRDELYQEVRLASNRMTDLIDSLLEFSRTRESLRPGLASVEETIERSIQTVRLHSEFQAVQIGLESSEDIEGWIRRQASGARPVQSVAERM